MKTNELTGAALDWAVAKCEPNMLDLYYSDENEPLILEEAPDYHQVWEPSINWAQGGQIIEREKIGVTFRDERDKWEVPNWSAWPTQTDDRQEIMGETHLIAAMRCYVASKLGDTVEVPEGLA